MDFDEHDGGDGDEEMTPMPVTSSYDSPMQPGLGLAGGGGAPKHLGADERGETERQVKCERIGPER